MIVDIVAGHDRIGAMMVWCEDNFPETPLGRSHATDYLGERWRFTFREEEHATLFRLFWSEFLHA